MPSPLGPTGPTNLRCSRKHHCNGRCNGSDANRGAWGLLELLGSADSIGPGSPVVCSCVDCGSSGRGFESLHPPQNQQVTMVGYGFSTGIVIECRSVLLPLSF